MDVRSITPGELWPDQIKKAIKEASTVVAVIGPGWLEVQGIDGRRCIDHAGDWVRKELAAALRAKKRVIAVYVKKAVPLSEEALPRTLKKLASCQAVFLRHEYWDHDMELLLALFPQPIQPVRAVNTAPNLCDSYEGEFAARSSHSSGHGPFYGLLFLMCAVILGAYFLWMVPCRDPAFVMRADPLTGYRETSGADQRPVYPGGVNLTLSIAVPKCESQKTILSALVPVVVAYHKKQVADVDTAVDVALAPPLGNKPVRVYQVSLNGKDVVSSVRKGGKEAVDVSASNLLSGDLEGIPVLNASEAARSADDDVRIFSVEFLPRQPGLYEVRLDVQYSIGEVVRKYESPAFRIYHEI